MPGRLAGDHAFVTGASRGIGRAIAERYVEEGATVALAARSEGTLRSICDDLGSNAIPIACDVTDTDAVNAAVKATIDEFGSLDIVTNVAGVIVRSDLVGTSDEEMDFLLDVNLKGLMRVARATIPELSKTDGTLINVSSQLGEVGVAGVSVYCASKGGINNLTRQLAVEYAEDNVRVNALAPGVIKTPMNEQVRREDSDWEANQLQYIPLNRLGTTDEVTGPAVFLASDESKYMTGHILVVDGGWLAQ